MNSREYIFCINYYYNNIVNKYPINYFCRKYTDILYGKDCYTMDSKWFKKLYNSLKEDTSLQLEENIKYCENKLKIR